MDFQWKIPQDADPEQPPSANRVLVVLRPRGEALIVDLPAYIHRWVKRRCGAESGDPEFEKLVSDWLRGLHGAHGLTYLQDFCDKHDLEQVVEAEERARDLATKGLLKIEI